MHNITSEEIAWAAGLFEGEGSAICRPAGGGRSRLQRRLQVTSTDKDVLDRFCSIVTSGQVVIDTRNRPSHHKQVYHWRCSRWPDVQRIALLLLPWLCSRRKEQVEYLLQHPAGPVGSPPKDFCKRGHPRTGTNANVYINAKTGAKACRQCQAEKAREYRKTLKASPLRS